MGDKSQDITGRTPPPIIRKLLRMGHSMALTIPAKWARQRNLQDYPYVIIRTDPDGALHVEPYAVDKLPPRTARRADDPD